MTTTRIESAEVLLDELLALEPAFPLLLDIEAEVALATAQMEAEGFFWDGAMWARTWVAAADARRSKHS